MAIKYRLADNEKEKAQAMIDLMNEAYNRGVEETSRREEQTQKINIDPKTKNRTTSKFSFKANGIGSNEEKQKATYISSDKKNNFLNDLQGIGSNFIRSVGNLAINAKEGIGRRMMEDTMQTNAFLNERNEKDIRRAYKNKGYSEKEIDEILKNRPTLESIANNSKILNNISEKGNKITKPIDNQLAEWEKSNNEKIEENIENASNSVTRKITELTPSIAQSSVNLLPGGVLFFSAGTTQDYYEKAINERGLSKEQASDYAAIMGTLESATEMVGATLTKGVGKAMAKGNIKNAFANYGLDVGENFLEEAVMEPFEELTVTSVAGKDKANWDNMGQRALRSGMDGALTSILMGGASAGVGKAVSVVEKVNNGQKVTQAEIKEAVNEVQKSGKVNVEKTINDEMQYYLNEAQKIINQENLTNNIQNNLTSQALNKAEQENQVKLPMPTEQKKILPVQQSVVTASDDLISSAKKYSLKYQDSNLNQVQNVFKTKGIDSRFDSSKFTDNKTGAMWQLTRDQDGNVRREIILNPNADEKTVIQEMAIHELTHDIVAKNTDTSTKLYNEVREWLARDSEYQKQLDQLKSVYGENVVEEEAIAKTLQTKFGNQESIDNLVNYNPSMSRRIYNWVVDKLNKITGGKIEKLYWEDVKNKFEKAYSEQGNYNQALNDSKYFIETIENFSEMKYNNANDISNQINYKELGILRHMIAEDSNIRPGLNRIYTTNAEYLIYLKDKINYKILSKKVDSDAGKLTERNPYTGRVQDGGTISRRSINNTITETGNDGISDINSQRESERIGDNRSSQRNNENVEDSNKSSFNLHQQIDNYIKNNNFNFKPNGNLEVGNLSNKQIKTLLNLYKTTGYEDVSTDYLNERLKQGNIIVPREVADRFIEKELGYKPKIDTTKVLEDSEGRKLTKEQIDFFKDSDVRDIRGRLIPVFHRTNADFTVFDKTAGKQHGAKYGSGFYFSITPENYGNNTMEVYLNAKEGEYKYIPKSGYYIVQNPNQIKNIDNTTPTESPDIRYSNNANFDEYIQNRVGKQGTRTTLGELKLPVQQQTQLNNLTNAEAPKQELPTKTGNTDEKIAEVLDKPFKEQKPKQRTWAIIKANLVDKGAVFEDLSRKTNNRELQAKWDATLSSGARGQYAIGQDRYEFKDGKQNKISKSLESIISEVGENEADFQNYMYHQLNIDRMTLEERFGIENKPVFSKNVDAEYSRKQIEKYERSNPEFKDYAQDVYDFLDANKKEMVNSGIISQELSNILADRYPHYVPIQRVGVQGNAITLPLDTKRTGVNTPLKKAKGGSQDIQPLFNTIADRTMQTYRASARNNFGVELKNSLNQLSLLNQSSENIDIDNIIDSISIEENNNELLQKGENGRNPTFTVFENGNKITYDINEDIYDALKPKNELLSKFDNSKLSKGIQAVGHFRRGLLTEYNPIFSITNSIKDAQDVLINSQHATKTYMKFPEAYAQILGKGYYYQEYMQNGGEQNSYFRDGDFTRKETQTVKDKAISKIKMPLEMISNVNNVIEMAPRLAEYIASRESGRSIEVSMLDAARVTTNFKAGGEVTKFANRNGATFLNASVQGLAQNVRNIKEAHQKGAKGYAVLAGKMAVAGLPALILNNLVWGDDDDYADLQDYVKDNYYIIGKYGDGQFIRIPKGRTVAVVQKIINNVDDFVNNKNELDIDEYAGQFWKDLKEDISFGMNNLAPNNPIENNIFSPIIQAATNKTWYGSDLVPTRLQDKPSDEQYDETTDKFSKWLGSKTGISPIKINYLIDQYTGGVGDVLLPMGTPQAENNAIEDKFTTNSVMKSRYSGEFFEKFDELNIKNNSDKATDEDKLKYKYFSSIRGETSKLYKQKREIQNSNDTDKVKKEKLLDVQKQINKLAEDALKNIKDVKVSGNTATIGGEEFYKDNDSWSKLSEKEKIDGVSLKDYATYKNATHGMKKESEKIEAIEQLKIKDDAKAKIYENTIGKDDNLYKVIKETDMNINQYLKYKTQKFESDKEDDGTTSGKTVSGSKKEKVYSYVNNMDITYNQKLVLLGTQYSLNKEEKTKLANYVNSLDVNKNTKLEIYEKLKGFTVYKDGTVKW